MDAYIYVLYIGHGQALPTHLLAAQARVASRRSRGRPSIRPEFEWDEANEDKLLRNHNVAALEAEQCFANPHTKRRVGDDLLMLGKTDGGRMLLLVYQQKPNGVVRVYSAREMTPAEKRTYRRDAK